MCSAFIDTCNIEAAVGDFGTYRLMAMLPYSLHHELGVWNIHRPGCRDEAEELVVVTVTETYAFTIETNEITYVRCAVYLLITLILTNSFWEVNFTFWITCLFVLW